MLLKNKGKTNRQNYKRNNKKNTEFIYRKINRWTRNKMREQGEKKTEPGNEKHSPNDQTIESKTKRSSKLFPKGSGMKISMWAYREKIQPRNNCISRAAFLLNLVSFEFRDQFGKIATNRLMQYNKLSGWKWAKRALQNKCSLKKCLKQTEKGR